MYRRECGALAKRHLGESLLCNHPAITIELFKKDVIPVINCSNLPVQSMSWGFVCDFAVKSELSIVCWHDVAGLPYSYACMSTTTCTILLVLSSLPPVRT